MATPNGIDCCNNQTLGYCIATTHFDWMGLKSLHLTYCYVSEIIFNSLVARHENMSHVTCLDVS